MSRASRARQHRGVDALLATAGELLVEVVRIVAVELDEQPARIVDARAGDILQNPVLGDALARAVRIEVGVARPAVEHAVRTARRSGGESAPFTERDVDAAQRQITGDAGPGRAAADHEHVGRSVHTVSRASERITLSHR